MKNRKFAAIVTVFAIVLVPVLALAEPPAEADTSPEEIQVFAYEDDNGQTLIRVTPEVKEALGHLVKQLEYKKLQAEIDRDLWLLNADFN